MKNAQNGGNITPKLESSINFSLIYFYIVISTGLKVTRKFLITVSDRNDAPTSIKTSGSLSISENSAPGTYIGNVYTVDQDAGQTQFYQIESVLAEGYKGKRLVHSTLVTAYTLEGVRHLGFAITSIRNGKS